MNAPRISSWLLLLAQLCLPTHLTYHLTLLFPSLPVLLMDLLQHQHSQFETKVGFQSYTQDKLFFKKKLVKFWNKTWGSSAYHAVLLEDSGWKKRPGVWAISFKNCNYRKKTTFLVLQWNLPFHIIRESALKSEMMILYYRSKRSMLIFRSHLIRKRI